MVMTPEHLPILDLPDADHKGNYGVKSIQKLVA